MEIQGAGELISLAFVMRSVVVIKLYLPYDLMNILKCSRCDTKFSNRSSVSEEPKFVYLILSTWEMSAL